MIFPIFEEQGNVLTNLKGEKTYHYQIKLCDLEKERDLEQFYNRVVKSLCDIPEGRIISISSFDDEVYLSSEVEGINLFGLKLTPHVRPLSIMGFDLFSQSVDFYGDYFLLNGAYYKILTVKEFPETLDFNRLQGVENFKFSFRRMGAAEGKTKLNFKRKMHFANLFSNMKNIESEAAYHESEDLLEKVTKNVDALFQGELTFIVRGESKAHLDHRVESIKRELKEIGFEVRVESHALTYLFNELIPGVNSTFRRSALIPATFIAVMLPMHCDFLMEDGIELNSISGRTVYFDLFNGFAHNYNVLITGQSGQGKSMLANKLIKEELERGTKAIILDLGGSFRKLTKYYDGVEFETKFNPLAFKDPIFLKEFISSFIDYELDGKMQGRLVRSIESNIDAISFRDLIEKVDLEFDDFSSYFAEFWDCFHDQPFCNNHLLYCDFSNYPEKLKSALILFLIEAFKRTEGRKIFLFDEAWGLLIKHAHFIAESFRTFRKYNASAIAIGQNLEDFIETPLGRVIAQNCFYRIYFKQTIASNEFCDSFEVNRIRDLSSVKGKYSEFLLSYEEMVKTLRFMPTNLEYELFTSDRNDNALFNNYFSEKGRFIGFNRAITNFTKLKYGEI